MPDQTQWQRFQLQFPGASPEDFIEWQRGQGQATPTPTATPDPEAAGIEELRKRYPAVPTVQLRQLWNWGQNRQTVIGGNRPPPSQVSVSQSLPPTPAPVPAAIAPVPTPAPVPAGTPSRFGVPLQNPVVPFVQAGLGQGANVGFRQFGPEYERARALGMRWGWSPTQVNQMLAATGMVMTPTQAEAYVERAATQKYGTFAPTIKGEEGDQPLSRWQWAATGEWQRRMLESRTYPEGGKGRPGEWPAGEFSRQGAGGRFTTAALAGGAWWLAGEDPGSVMLPPSLTPEKIAKRSRQLGAYERVEPYGPGGRSLEMEVPFLMGPTSQVRERATQMQVAHPLYEPIISGRGFIAGGTWQGAEQHMSRIVEVPEGFQPKNEPPAGTVYNLQGGEQFAPFEGASPLDLGSWRSAQYTGSAQLDPTHRIYSFVRDVGAEGGALSAKWGGTKLGLSVLPQQMFEQFAGTGIEAVLPVKEWSGVAMQTAARVPYGEMAEILNRAQDKTVYTPEMLRGMRYQDFGKDWMEAFRSEILPKYTTDREYTYRLSQWEYGQIPEERRKMLGTPKELATGQLEVTQNIPTFTSPWGEAVQVRRDYPSESPFIPRRELERLQRVAPKDYDLIQKYNEPFRQALGGLLGASYATEKGTAMPGAREMTPAMATSIVQSAIMVGQKKLGTEGSVPPAQLTRLILQQASEEMGTSPISWGGGRYSLSPGHMERFQTRGVMQGEEVSGLGSAFARAIQARGMVSEQPELAEKAVTDLMSAQSLVAAGKPGGDQSSQAVRRFFGARLPPRRTVYQQLQTATGMGSQYMWLPEERVLGALGLKTGSKRAEAFLGRWGLGQIQPTARVWGYPTGGEQMMEMTVPLASRAQMEEWQVPISREGMIASTALTQAMQRDDDQDMVLAFIGGAVQGRGENIHLRGAGRAYTAEEVEQRAELAKRYGAANLMGEEFASGKSLREIQQILDYSNWKQYGPEQLTQAFAEHEELRQRIGPAYNLMEQLEVMARRGGANPETVTASETLFGQIYGVMQRPAELPADLRSLLDVMGGGKEWTSGFYSHVGGDPRGNVGQTGMAGLFAGSLRTAITGKSMEPGEIASLWGQGAQSPEQYQVLTKLATQAREASQKSQKTVFRSSVRQFLERSIGPEQSIEKMLTTGVGAVLVPEAHRRAQAYIAKNEPRTEREMEEAKAYVNLPKGIQGKVAGMIEWMQARRAAFGKFVPEGKTLEEAMVERTEGMETYDPTAVAGTQLGRTLAAAREPAWTTPAAARVPMQVPEGRFTRPYAQWEQERLAAQDVGPARGPSPERERQLGLGTEVALSERELAEKRAQLPPVIAEVGSTIGPEHIGASPRFPATIPTAQIVEPQEFADWFGTGRGFKTEELGGAFRPRTGEIKIQPTTTEKEKDRPERMRRTYAHEMGHSIDKTFGLSKDPAVRQEFQRQKAAGLIDVERLKEGGYSDAAIIEEWVAGLHSMRATGKRPWFLKSKATIPEPLEAAFQRMDKPGFRTKQTELEMPVQGKPTGLGLTIGGQPIPAAAAPPQAELPTAPGTGVYMQLGLTEEVPAAATPPTAGGAVPATAAQPKGTEVEPTDGEETYGQAQPWDIEREPAAAQAPVAPRQAPAATRPTGRRGPAARRLTTLNYAAYQEAMDRWLAEGTAQGGAAPRPGKPRPEDFRTPIESEEARGGGGGGDLPPEMGQLIEALSGWMGRQEKVSKGQFETAFQAITQGLPKVQEEIEAMTKGGGAVDVTKMRTLGSALRDRRTIERYMAQEAAAGGSTLDEATRQNVASLRGGATGEFSGLSGLYGQLPEMGEEKSLLNLLKGYGIDLNPEAAEEAGKSLDNLTKRLEMSSKALDAFMTATKDGTEATKTQTNAVAQTAREAERWAKAIERQGGVLTPEQQAMRGRAEEIGLGAYGAQLGQRFGGGGGGGGGEGGDGLFRVPGFVEGVGKFATGMTGYFNLMRMRRVWEMTGGVAMGQVPGAAQAEQLAYGGAAAGFPLAQYQGGQMAGGLMSLQARRADMGLRMGEAAYTAYGGLMGATAQQDLGTLGGIGLPALGLGGMAFVGAGIAGVGTVPALAAGGLIGGAALAVGTGAYIGRAATDPTRMAMAAAGGPGPAEGVRGTLDWVASQYGRLSPQQRAGLTGLAAATTGVLGPWPAIASATAQLGIWNQPAREPDVALGQQVRAGQLQGLNLDERAAAIQYGAQVAGGPGGPLGFMSETQRLQQYQQMANVGWANPESVPATYLDPRFAGWARSGLDMGQWQSLSQGWGYGKGPGAYDLFGQYQNVPQDAGQRQGFLSNLEMFQPLARQGVTSQQIGRLGREITDPQQIQMVRALGQGAGWAWSQMGRQMGVPGWQTENQQGMQIGTNWGGGILAGRLGQAGWAGQQAQAMGAGAAGMVTLGTTAVPFTQWGIQDFAMQQQQAQQNWQLQQQRAQLQMGRGYQLDTRAIQGGAYIPGTMAGEQYQYQLGQFGFQQRGMEQGNRQFMERWSMGWQQNQQQQAWQGADMPRERARQQIQFGWQEQDLAYQGARTSLQFGWQMEDVNEQMRFATGRQRRTLMRQRERATVSYGMEMGQLETQEGRLKTREDWAEEDFNREKGRFEQRKTWSEQEMLLQLKHHNEDVKLQTDQFKTTVDHFKTVTGFEEKLRVLQVKYQDDQYKMQVAELAHQTKYIEVQQQIDEAQVALGRAQQAQLNEFRAQFDQGGLLKGTMDAFVASFTALWGPEGPPAVAIAQTADAMENRFNGITQMYGSVGGGRNQP